MNIWNIVVSIWKPLHCQRLSWISWISETDNDRWYFQRRCRDNMNTLLQIKSKMQFSLAMDDTILMNTYWNCYGAVWIVEILSGEFQLPSTYLYIRLGNSQPVMEGSRACDTKSIIWSSCLIGRGKKYIYCLKILNLHFQNFIVRHQLFSYIYWKSGVCICIISGQGRKSGGALGNLIPSFCKFESNFIFLSDSVVKYNTYRY